MNARGWLLLLLLALALGAGVIFLVRGEGTPPEVIAPDSLVVGVKGRDVAFDVGDSGSGLRNVDVVLVHAQGEESLLFREFPGSFLGGGGPGPEKIEVFIDSKAVPPVLDEAVLRIEVRDRSWRSALSGNETRVDVPVVIDRRPPRVGVATGLSYVRRGGSGVVVYALSEPAVRDGVKIGETFFPSFPLGDQRVVFYAVPTDAPADPEVRVIAEDAAGNEGRGRWPVVVRERKMPEANVNLPSRFLTETSAELAMAEGIDEEDPKAAFHLVNTDVRARNEKQIRAAFAEPSQDRLWQGAFQQQSNSKVTSRFAERRGYYVDGTRVSEATHFGYDLASTRAAPIEAAAAGRVVYADDLGIYGNCVLVDHGMGVGSLYGHLSRIDVSVGEEVGKGQALGLSGATGLAGGDHLHFAILVGGVYVDPIEWWDPKWVADNVEGRLATASE